MTYLYTAEGIVDSTVFPTPLKTTGYNYRHLTENMARLSQDVRFYTEGENGGINFNEKEPFTKDLIWPKVSWKITREVREDE